MNLAETWITIAESSRLLGISARMMRYRVSSQKYLTRQVPGAQAGKLRTEICAASLPANVQKLLLNQFVNESNTHPIGVTPPAGEGQAGSPQPESKSVAIDPCTSEAALAWYDSLPDDHKAIIDRREQILLTIRQETTDLETGKTEAIKTLCAERGISPATFYNWNSAYDIAHVKGLASRRFGSSRAKLTEDQRHYLITLIRQNPARRPERLWEYVNQKFPSQPVSGSTVTRFIRTWKKNNKSFYRFLCDPDAWKGEYMASFGSESDKAVYFGEYWETDSTPTDLLLADGKRYNLVGMIDIFSRKVKVVVSKTSNSHAIANCVRASIIDWGLPANIVSDNGKDFTSKHVTAICKALGINQVVVAPFSPEKKPHIERFFRTLSTGLFEELQGFIGHNVAERKAIEAQKSFAQRFMGGGEIEVNLQPGQLQAIIDQWTENIYHQRRHAGIGMSPEVKSAQCNIALRHVENIRALDILLQPIGERIVGKKGIKFENGNYISPDLVPYIGEEVRVRVDNKSAGTLYVFNLQNEYVCTATDSRLVDITATEYRNLRKAQRQALNEQKKAIATLESDPMLDLIASAGQSSNIRGIKPRKPVRLKTLEEAESALERVGRKPNRYKTIYEQEMERQGRDLEPHVLNDDDLDFVERLEIPGQEDDDSLDFLDDVAING